MLINLAAHHNSLTLTATEQVNITAEHYSAAWRRPVSQHDRSFLSTKRGTRGWGGDIIKLLESPSFLLKAAFRTARERESRESGEDTSHKQHCSAAAAPRGREGGMENSSSRWTNSLTEPNQRASARLASNMYHICWVGGSHIPYMGSRKQHKSMKGPVEGSWSPNRFTHCINTFIDKVCLD